MIRLGIDLGGTKTEIIALGVDGGELLRRRVETPKEDYGGILKTVARLVRDAEAELGDRGSVGVGTPGSISRATGLLRGSNSCASTASRSRPTSKRCSPRSADHNDANCFAMSEATPRRGRAELSSVSFSSPASAGIVVCGHVLTVRMRCRRVGHNPCLAKDYERPASVLRFHRSA